MDFVLHRSDLDQRQIFIFGRSLGGAVAIFLASSPLYAQHICALIIENTFTSIPVMGQHIFRTRLISYIPHWCFKNLVSERDRTRSCWKLAVVTSLSLVCLGSVCLQRKGDVCLEEGVEFYDDANKKSETRMTAIILK